MSMLLDIGAIKDEDLLRRMWQETDDFCRKKEIRAHMYKLRETRLRDFYSGDMDAGIGLSKTPLTASHGDSLADQSFQSFKTKEIRDSESPTREFKYGVPANLGGWNIMTSSELSNDGKMHTTHSLATTGGVHDLADGQAKFTGRNEKMSSVAFDGDDKNYTTSSGENTNTVLEENIVQGNENNRRIENKKSTVTTSSKILRSHYESGDNGFDNEPQYAPSSETIERKTIYNEAPQPRVMSQQQQPNNNGPRNNIPASNTRSEQLISRTVEYPDPHTKVIREVTSLPDGSTITTTKYETRSANSELWTSSNTSKNTSSSTSRVVKEDRAEHNRIQYIIDDRGNQVPYQPNRHVQNKTTKDVEGYEIIIDTTTDRNVPITKTIKKDLTRDMERLTDQDDVVRTTITTTTTKTNHNNDVYDVKRPTNKIDKKPIEPEYTRKRISVDLDPTHEAFARSLRCVSPVSDRDSIRSHRSATSSIRSSISPDKGFRARRSNSRDTDISQISSQTITKSGPTPGLKSPQRALPGKRPDTTTTTIKTEKIIRIPGDRKPDNQTPRQPSQVTDLDSDDTTETKTTTVTATTTENKDRTKPNRPPFVRSETYEERCRKILGMPEPDEQPKSPVTRRSKLTTTTTDFIENEKVDIAKNRTVATNRQTPVKSPEKSPVRKLSGRPTKDDTTVDTNTFDRKTPRRPESSSPDRKPGTNTGDEPTQRRPNENVPDNKSPSQASPDRRSPSKIIETTTTTVTHKSPRGHSPDRKTPNRESPERKPSKIVETTKTISRDTPRRPTPGDDRVSPDRKSSSRRPNPDQGSSDRKTVVTKNIKNLEKYDAEINETIVDRKQPYRPTNKSDESDEELIDVSEPEYETIERKPTRRPTNELVSDDETPNRPHKIVRNITDTENNSTKTKTKSINTLDQGKPRGPHGNEPETDEEITETVITETLLDRKQPDRPSRITEEVIETTTSHKTARRPIDGPRRPTDYETPTGTRKTPRRHNDGTPDYETPDHPSKTTETDEEFLETAITRKPQRHPNDTLPKTPSSRKIPSNDHPTNFTKNVVETDEETSESTVTHKTQRRPNDESPDRQSPDRRSPDYPSQVTEEITETTITRKTPHHTKDVLSNKIPDRRSPDRPSKFTTNVNETNKETVGSHFSRKTQLLPNDESSDRQSPNGTITDRQSLDRKFETTSHITETAEDTIESNVIRRRPIEESPDRVKTQPASDRRSPERTDRSSKTPDRQLPGRTVPERRSPDRKFSTTTNIIETEEDTIESTLTRRRPNEQSPDRLTTRPASDRRSPGHPSQVTEEITETITSRKTPLYPEDRNPTRSSKTPDRQSPSRAIPERRSPDRKFSTTTNINETDEDTIESTLTRRRPNEQSPDRLTTRPASDRGSPGHPSRVIEEITETITSRKTPHYPEDRKPTTRSSKIPDRQSPGRAVPDRRSPDRKTITEITEDCTPDQRSPDRSIITSNVTGTNEEFINTTTVTRKTPDRHSPGRSVPNYRSPVRNVTETVEETFESTVSRATKRRENQESPERTIPDRCSPERPSTITTKVTGTNENFVEPSTVSRKSPDRKTPVHILKITETVVSRKTPHHPEDDLPDRKSPNRRSPEGTSPDRQPSGRIVHKTETVVSRKTPRRPGDDSPDRKSPDRKPTGRTIHKTETVVSRKTPRLPGDDSPDRMSPNQRSPERISPDRQSTGRTVHKTETVISRKTPRRPQDDSPDRKSPNNRSPERLSPDRQSTGRSVHKTETVVSRKTSRGPEDYSPDRKSPDRKPTGRIIHKTETVVSRKTPRLPGDDSPDRKSPNHRSPERISPDRQSTGRTVNKTETVISRKTPRRPQDDSPDRKSPNNRSPERLSPDRQSTGRSVHKTETVVSRKTSRGPEDDSPDRKSPNRRSPDRPSARTINVTGRNEEFVKTTVTRETVDRQSPRRTIPDHRSPERPTKYTSDVNETDEEVVSTTVTRKTQQRPNDIPVCSVPDRRSPDRKTTISSTRSSERPSKITRNITAVDKEITESTHSRKTYRQPNDESPDRRSHGRKTPNHRSPDRPSRTTTNHQEITETTVTRKNQQSPNDDFPDRRSSGRNVPNHRSPDRKSPTKVTETKITRTIPRLSEKSPDRPYRTTKNRTDTDEELVETNVTGKALRRPNGGSPERRSPDRKTVDRSERPSKISKEITETTTVISKTQKHPTTRSPERKTKAEKPQRPTVDNTSPVRSSKITTNRNDEEFNETVVSTRKIQRHPTDESPDRKIPTRKTITTVTKTTTGRRPTPTYTDETSSLKRKPVSKSPEEIVESDEPLDELTTNRRRGDINREPGYLRPTQSSRPKVQSPDRKISTATFVNETDEEIRETSITRRPGYEQPDQSGCEPVNRRPVSKIPDIRSPDRKSSTTNITRRPLSEDKSPTRRTSRTRFPDQDENEPVHRMTTTKTTISQQPVDRSPERRTSDESEIDDETVQINQYEEFIQNEMDATETNRPERPGPLRRKPDDVEVIFERAVDLTNVTEVDNILVEGERAVGCRLTGEPDEPNHRPQESSPMKYQPYESSPGRRTTLKKSSKFDDETEEITTTVEQRTIRRPTVSETSPDRTSRSTKPRSPETSPIRHNIVKTVKEIIISPTQPRRVLKQPRSPETSPTRRTTHITTITKTIPDRSTPTTPSKSRPQTTPSQPGQRKPNIDRINSEIITDRDEKRTTTASTTIRSKQKTAPEIVPSIVHRYTTKTESPVSRPIKKKLVESTPGPTEVVEEVFVKKEVKKLCDGDVCGPRPLTNGTLPAKRIVPKQETSVRPVSKFSEKVDRVSTNTTTTHTNKRTSITERKNTAPIIPSNRVPATDKFGRSASENQIRTPHTPKIEVDEPVTKERRPSLKSKTARPTKCIATKTINITNTNLTVDSDEMDIVIDIQQAKSSREPSPNKIIPVPVSPETDTGPSRYPDNVTEPEDERKPRRKVTNVPIFEEETNTFVSCDITEVSADHVAHYEDLEEGNVDDSDDDVDHNRIVNVTDNDECLLSVSDKVSRFINLADETVTSKVTTKNTEIDRAIIDRRRPITKDLENDDCLLSVSDKVSKFITTAEQFKKPKASIDFITIEKINETENRLRPETTEDEEIDDEEVEENIRVDKTNRLNARKVTKVVEKKPSETVITTTTTTTTRKVKPVVTRPLDEEITVNRPKETKVSTIASKFTKPNDQLSRQSSIKRITTDTKVSSIRTKFDKNIEPDDGADEPTDEELDIRGREPFFLNQNGTNNQQIETISKIVQSSYVDQVPDDHQTPPKGSVTDRFKPTAEGSKIKKITPTAVLQSTEIMKKAKEIFENKPNDRPKQIDILSRPSVWKYKTNDVKLTDIGVHTTKTTKTTEEIETSDEEVEAQPEVPKTPKLSARDEFTLKNLRDVTNISSKKDLFERKFSSDRNTTTNTTTNREFSESPVGGSPTSNKPSYMNHTVSSLEHINRRDSRSQITSDHESIDDNNSINSNKFGVELRRVDSQNATKTRRKSSSTEIPCVEEIFDLELLERMLETVVGYEHRRRIRSQIRIIKKQIEEEEMHTSHHHQTTSSEITTKRISKERTRSPTSKRNETTTAPKSQPARQISPMRTMTKTTRVLDEPDQKVSKIVTTTTTITKGDITDDGKPIWTKKNLLKKPSETQMVKTPTSATTTSSSTTRKFNTSSYREVEKTDSVTSSYGIGPTDENGKPLFGIRALKKQAQKTEHPKEPVYSTDSDPYQTDDQTRKIAKSINLRAPQKIREGYQSASTTTVKKSTKNFIQHEIDDEPESSTEEIEEYEEYESNDRAATKFTKNVHSSNVESFLGSEKKTYTGFNDVIDRMRNADHVQVEGDTESDREARALLNKFLGASILVQATESVLPDGVKVTTQKTTRTLKSDSPVATSATRQVTTTKLTKVKSSNNSKDSSCNNTGAVATTITTTAVNDIDSIWDESYLRKLLEQSSSYEERRKIRARIRQIMADKEGGKTTTEIVKETKKDDDAGVTTTTTKVTTTRTVTASKPVSPFAKFRQLDKASTQSPPNSPHTPNTPKTPGQTTAPIFKFTDPALNRRVATFKEQLLQWCQFKTREYENVKIENFSTSWSDGLAFCALIHHFRPDAFDYTKLVATQRRYNFDLAFRVADEKAGIAPLLDVEDMVVMRKPDWKCVFTYVQSIYRRFKDAD